MYSAKDKRETGKFVGFILLKKHGWNKSSFVRAMSKRWGIILEEKEDTGGSEDMLLCETEEFALTLMFLDRPVPDGEAEMYAQENYMWKNAVKEVSKHTSQIIVSARGANGNIKAGAEIFVKAADAALGQTGAVGFCSDGAVYKKDHFRDDAAMLKDGNFPIENLIWFGFYNDGKQYGFYTKGLNRFGKNEIEVYADTERNIPQEEIRNFAADAAKYIILEDVDLQSGETIGFDENDIHHVRVNDGLAVEGNTVKIFY